MGGQQISKPIGKPKVGGSNLGVTKNKVKRAWVKGVVGSGVNERVWWTRGCGQ